MCLVFKTEPLVPPLLSGKGGTLLSVHPRAVLWTTGRVPLAQDQGRVKAAAFYGPRSNGFTCATFWQQPLQPLPTSSCWVDLGCVFSCLTDIRSASQVPWCCLPSCSISPSLRLLSKRGIRRTQLDHTGNVSFWEVVQSCVLGVI